MGIRMCILVMWFPCTQWGHASPSISSPEHFWNLVLEIYTKCHQGNVILIKNNSIKNYISQDFLNQSLTRFLKKMGQYSNSLYSTLNIHQSPEGKVLSSGNRTQRFNISNTKAPKCTQYSVSFTSQPSYIHRSNSHL